VTRFDWYAATIDQDAERVLATLASEYGASVVPGIARNGYAEGWDLRAEGSTVAHVLTGGSNGAPHAWASSDETDEFVRIVRANWPDRHRVTRMDAAEDFDAPGAWDTLYGLVLGLADERALAINQAGDWHRGEAGRTFYAGGTKSAVRARLYEKGLQLRGLDPDHAGDYSPDLVRLELQVRPEGAGRYRAARCEPVEAYGYADWSRVLAERVFGADVERVWVRERRESDDERALGWCVRQYGEHLERLAVRVGGWARVGVELQAIRDRQQQRESDPF
jgi:hypothetical protein